MRRWRLEFAKAVIVNGVRVVGKLDLAAGVLYADVTAPPEQLVEAVWDAATIAASEGVKMVPIIGGTGGRKS